MIMMRRNQKHPEINKMILKKCIHQCSGTLLIYPTTNQFIKQKDRSATYIDMHEIHAVDIEIV